MRATDVLARKRGSLVADTASGPFAILRLAIMRSQNEILRPDKKLALDIRDIPSAESLACDVIPAYLTIRPKYAPWRQLRQPFASTLWIFS
jgi:hypothetical protein